MKNIRIDSSTYYFIALLFLCGLIKNGIIIFIIVLVHEFGHSLASILLGYNVKSVTIYPFGGITKLDKDINSPIIKDLIVAVAGVFLQVLLFLIFYIVYKYNLISLKTYNLFIFYNNSIMFFNLLPIIPLDGSKILELFINKLFSFKTSFYVNALCSSFTLVMFCIYLSIYKLNNYMIIFFLLFKLYEYFKDKKYVFSKFLLERYINTYNFKHIKNYKYCNINKLKKDTFFYFYTGKYWISEKKLIKKEKF